MKLPHNYEEFRFWLLRRLSIWEYICPSCQQPLGYEQRVPFCPRCRTYIEVPIRVPSRILKDKRALSNYVHKYIMPSLTLKQYNYLARFFTVIFSDGFEAADWMWTGTTVSSGDAINIIIGAAHHGIRYGQADLGGDGSEAAYCYETITGQTTLYVRAYFRLQTALPVDGQYVYVITARGSGNHASIYFSNIGGDYRFTLRSMNGATTEYTPYSYAYALNTWYCLELYVYVHATDGAYTVWLNGNQVIALSGKDSDDYGNIVTVQVGCRSSNFTVAHEVDFDCAVIADAYIGTEAKPSGRGIVQSIMSAKIL